MRTLRAGAALLGQSARSHTTVARLSWLLPALLLPNTLGCSDDSGALKGSGPVVSLPSGAEAGQFSGQSDAGSLSDATVDRAPVTTGNGTPPRLDGGSGDAAPADGATGSTGGALPDASSPPDNGGGSGKLTGPFPPVTDFAKDGPYPSTTLQNTGPGNNYTVYLPMTLAPDGAKNPIVGWMSGGATTHDLYPLLPRLATHGFVVVAANVAPGIGEEDMLGKQIIAGIDWAIAENVRSGSMLFGKLDTTKIASMGYSMGSLSTFMIASDPRLTTTVHISGGNMAPERVNNLRAPAVFICGIPGPSSCSIVDTTCDIAATNCDTDFSGAKTPVFYANFNGGHLGILLPPTEDQIGALATTWLRWKLMSDRSLDKKFLGDQCEVCKDMTWTKVQRKNL